MKVYVQDLVDEDSTERLFTMADNLFRSAKQKRFSDRVKWVVKITAPKQTEFFERALSKDSEQSVNEAYLIRNCIVHRGGLADKKLLAESSDTIGSKIVLTDDRMKRLLTALADTANALSSCSPFGVALGINE